MEVTQPSHHVHFRHSQVKKASSLRSKLQFLPAIEPDQSPEISICSWVGPDHDSNQRRRGQYAEVILLRLR